MAGLEKLLEGWDEEIEEVPRLVAGQGGEEEAVAPVQAEEIVRGEVEVIGEGAKLAVIGEGVSGLEETGTLDADGEDFGQVAGAEALFCLQLIKAFHKFGRQAFFLHFSSSLLYISSGFILSLAGEISVWVWIKVTSIKYFAYFCGKTINKSEICANKHCNYIFNL